MSMADKKKHSDKVRKIEDQNKALKKLIKNIEKKSEAHKQVSNKKIKK